jgi:5-methylcytosine-specific restriction enzyme A
MGVIEDLKPNSKKLILDLLDEAGLYVGDWGDYAGKHASSNPKSYNWSFVEPGEKIALCLWHDSLEPRGRAVYHHSIPRTHTGPAQKRAQNMRQHVRMAYEEQLPIRVIVCITTRVPGVTSKVEGRLLDPQPWAVKEYDTATGEWLLIRGKDPLVPAFYPPDNETPYFEGSQRAKFVLHRRREGQLRRSKIAEALAERGRLFCEVPNCGFDFVERYGALGEGYAQVHHTIPLNKAPKEGRPAFTKDMAIVCANCHAMIHRNGDCRPLEGLI